MKKQQDPETAETVQTTSKNGRLMSAVCAEVMADFTEQLRAIAEMKEYDQDDAHRLRGMARQFLSQNVLSHPPTDGDIDDQVEGATSQPPTCYALVLYTYDHHEWEETLAASFDEAKLKTEYESLDHLYSDRNLVSLEAHESLRDREEAHWVIEPVKFLA